jgi:ankyrin repeat protein
MLNKAQVEKLFESVADRTFDIQTLSSIDGVADLRDIDSCTLLDVAIKSKDSTVCSALLQSTFLASDEDQENAIHLCVVADALEILEQILSKVDRVYPYICQRGFRSACESGKPAIVRLFLSKCPGLDLDEPLIDTAKAGHVEVVRELIHAGAQDHLAPGGVFFDRLLCFFDPKTDLRPVTDVLLAGRDIADMGEFANWMYAGMYGPLSLAQRLVARGPTADDLSKALHGACVAGNAELAAFLLDAAAQRQLKLLFRRLLVEAVRAGRTHIVQLLFEHIDAAAASASANTDDDDIDLDLPSLLFHAVRESHVDLVALLLARGAHADTLLGDNPVLAFASDPAVVGLLIDAKADANPPDLETNLLSWPCEQLRLDTVRALLDAGADITAGASGCSPVLSAMQGCREGASEEDKMALLELLLDAGARTVPEDESATTLHQCAMLPDYVDAAGPARRLLRHDPALLEAVNEDGHTALLSAVLERRADLTAVLVEAGADTAATDADGVPALHLLFLMFPDVNVDALEPRRMRDTLRALLPAVDLAATDRGRRTVLMAAAATKLPRYLISDDTLSILLDDVLGRVLTAGMGPRV